MRNNSLLLHPHWNRDYEFDSFKTDIRFYKNKVKKFVRVQKLVIFADPNGKQVLNKINVSMFKSLLKRVLEFSFKKLYQ